MPDIVFLQEVTYETYQLLQLSSLVLAKFVMTEMPKVLGDCWTLALVNRTIANAVQEVTRTILPEGNRDVLALHVLREKLGPLTLSTLQVDKGVTGAAQLTGLDSGVGKGPNVVVGDIDCAPGTVFIWGIARLERCDTFSP